MIVIAVQSVRSTRVQLIQEHDGSCQPVRSTEASGSSRLINLPVSEQQPGMTGRSSGVTQVVRCITEGGTPRENKEQLLTVGIEPGTSQIKDQSDTTGPQNKFLW